MGRLPAATPGLGSLHHVAIAVRDLDEAVEYYRNVLDLNTLETPPEAVASGVRWLDLGEGRALHLIEVEGVTAPPRAHLAITVGDNDAWRAHLEGKGVGIIEPTVSLYAAKRFFLRDPSGNLLELVEWLED